MNISILHDLPKKPEDTFLQFLDYLELHYYQIFHIRPFIIVNGMGQCKNTSSLSADKTKIINC